MVKICLNCGCLAFGHTKRCTRELENNGYIKTCGCKKLEVKTAEQLLNETETEPFTIEERTDLNINKVTHDKVKRTNK